MKKSINYWSFVGGLDGTKGIKEYIADAKACGFEAVEICVGDTGKFTLDATEKQCGEIRAAAEKAGLEIASLATGIWWQRNVGATKVAERTRAEQSCKKMIQIADWLGAGALLYIPGAVDVFFNPASEVIPYDVLMARAKEGTKRLLRVAEQHKIALCVENVWNRFLLSPLEMRDFVDGFSSEYVGVYFDTGNVVIYGYPEQWITILGKRIRRVHFKDFKRAVGNVEGFCDLLEGDVNWPAVMRAFKMVGYDGYCTAEILPPYRHDALQRVRNTSGAMDAIFRM